MSLAARDLAPEASPRLGFPATAALLALVLGGIGLLGWSLAGLGRGFVLAALSIYVVAAALVGTLARRRLGTGPFGAANSVTLLRAALASALLALVFEPASDPGAWFAVVVATAALLLDGVDGRLARRSGTSTAFGARFDMETDAALIMILAVLCWQLDKTGPWVLAAGAMRYVFVLAARIWPRLGRPLPPCRRRQTVCIVLATGLVIAISPFFPPPSSSIVALAALTLLTLSFGADLRWLLATDAGT
jgi:phosphatidylglycerophosphate synthase